jgi:hypothetical protein
MAKSSMQTDYSLYVKEFADYRGNNYRIQSFWDGMPLVYSYTTFRDKPEEKYNLYKNNKELKYASSEFTTGYKLNIEKDLKKALENSILTSNLFKITNQQTSEYSIDSKILDFKYTRKNYLYGISGFGQMLGLVGIPTQKSYFDIRLSYSLIDNKTKKEIFSKIYSKTEKLKFSPYSFDENKYIGAFSKIFQEINNNLIDDLEVLFSTQVISRK